MKPHRLAAALLLAPTATLAEPINDDFESYAPGTFPGAPWQDVSTRIDNPTVPAPTAFVLETTGADGLPTQAVQIVDNIGTSSGVMTEIQPADRHTLRMDVRIDQFSDVRGSWPGGIGFLQDEGASDFNADPQAVLYAWQDGRWHLFVKNSPDGLPIRNTDRILAGIPRINPGTWYTLQLEIDTTTGVFDASVYNATTGELLGEDSLNFTDWDPQFGRFDAIAAFDGEGGTAGTVGGVSTYDNFSYIPAPSAAIFAAVSAAMAAVRRR